MTLCMRVFLTFLAAYVLSQFYRAFLAVLSPNLQADLGATPAQLADASGLWFLVFAAMQIPVGIALDRIGPRRTVASILGLAGAGGTALFAMAQGPGAIVAAIERYAFAEALALVPGLARGLGLDADGLGGPDGDQARPA